ncbi:hypothetical protein COU76_01630 [Candidatus Peregrinibacteria bacterium CG10_big_fil_rev_8_21_14_0_10_49_10]|nr:MAG: hypothetical protein COU76_01630 [Candidatus Peregrinibacteria bacterium CG10_big_fil_rev_8_21_14_0_10_49_10]
MDNIPKLSAEPDIQLIDQFIRKELSEEAESQVAAQIASNRAWLDAWERQTAIFVLEGKEVA